MCASGVRRVCVGCAWGLGCVGWGLGLVSGAWGVGCGRAGMWGARLLGERTAILRLERAQPAARLGAGASLGLHSGAQVRGAREVLEEVE